jgi:hypothetical protein
MQAGGVRKLGSGKDRGGVKRDLKEQPKVRMYNRVPLDDIDLESFETWSLDRLQGE